MTKVTVAHTILQAQFAPSICSSIQPFGSIHMTIQIKDLPVAREVATSEMNAVHGGVGGQGLSAGKSIAVVDSEDAKHQVSVHEIVITKTVDSSSVK